MDLLKFIWISRRINGGLQISFRFWLPWDRLLVGYAGADVDEVESNEASAFKGSLFLLLFELEFIRVKMDDSFWEEHE
jgi:hypothetical protein